MKTLALLSLLITVSVSLSNAGRPYGGVGGSHRNGGGFTADLIPRDSPLSPLYNPAYTRTDRLRNAFLQSVSRASRSSKRVGLTSDVEADISSISGGYVMHIQIGTPPVEVVGVADTGSDLTWAQCQPCKNCYNQTGLPFLQPNASSTYRAVSCKSTACDLETSWYSCGSKNVCQYLIQYGDQSYTRGDLANDTFSIGSTQLKSTVFGCGRDNKGTFSADTSGLIGLGPGPLSIINQLNDTIQGKFSYCLVPMFTNCTNATGKIHFGDQAVVSGPGVVSTPLKTTIPSSYYYLVLEHVSVGARKLPYKSINAIKDVGSDLKNIVIDSGTTLTILPRIFHDELTTALTDVIGGETVPDPQGILDLCYKDLDLGRVPKITFGFTGAAVEVPPENAFLEVENGVSCLTIVPSEGRHYGDASGSHRNGGGFTADLIPRDSPLSPLYNPAYTRTDRLQNAFLQSVSRASRFSKRAGLTSDVEADISSISGGYVMHIQIGTPPIEVVGVADTGSDLTWAQCQPCKNCYNQTGLPFLQPNASSTYRAVSCKSTACDLETSWYSCGSKNVCQYLIQYGDQSYTRGDLANDTFSIGSTQLKSTVFGCGRDNKGTFSADTSGLIGLGPGPLSIINQLNDTIQGKFSYCLVPMFTNCTNATGKIHFGDQAVVSGPGVVSTPLKTTIPSSYYYLVLEHVSVGARKLPYKSTNAIKDVGSDLKNIVIDSGTTLTILPRIFHDELTTALTDVIGGETVPDPQGILDLCYKDLDLGRVPKITFGFTGAAVEVPPENAFLEVENGVEPINQRENQEPSLETVAVDPEPSSEITRQPSLHRQLSLDSITVKSRDSSSSRIVAIENHRRCPEPPLLLSRTTT
ncbi:hypothetical protein OSB04_003659 [Centaurea solstitialis]|uniref:Peptidase A1 domain-containing protein n=1 Tax=Centaurea solstitialis TaxID=347529 RepID=A0AA38U2S3_9ASTR|nr:hypothetical protein OSB04_003659 [Centaurea solstitialis]